MTFKEWMERKEKYISMISNKQYILIDKTPVLEPNLFKWGHWMSTNKRHVEDTEIGDVRISTVFLGLDHNHSGEGDPLLFETMTFPDISICERYSTYAKAEAGHWRIVQLVRLTESVL